MVCDNLGLYYGWSVMMVLMVQHPTISFKGLVYWVRVTVMDLGTFLRRNLNFTASMNVLLVSRQ